MGTMKILNTNAAIYTIELHEAKVVPFKSLEQAWTRTGGDKAKQAKLIQKYDLKTLISSVRPGSIKLGVMNKLNNVTGNATAAGIDLDGELIFITNNPLKIVYPKKSTRRPEGQEIEEADDGAIVEEKKSLGTLRLEKMVSLVIREDDCELVENFVKSSNFTIDSSTSEIKKAYKLFESGVKALTENLKEDYQKVLDAMLKNGSNKKEAEELLKKHYPYVDKAYRSSSASKKAEIIVSLAASESADLKEAAKPSNGESTVGLDVVDAKSAMKDMKKFKLKTKEGKGNGSADEVIVTGKNVDIFKYLTSNYYDMDTDEIEEFYPELFESVDLEEAFDRLPGHVKTAVTQLYSLAEVS
jgi:hypothetical protein